MEVSTEERAFLAGFVLGVTDGLRHDLPRTLALMMDDPEFYAGVFSKVARALHPDAVLEFDRRHGRVETSHG